MTNYKEEIEHPDITKMRLYGTLDEEKVPRITKSVRCNFKSENGVLLTDREINDIISVTEIEHLMG